MPGALGPKLGPILLQLPPDLPADAKRLQQTLTEFPPGTRVAVEPRHPSWFVDEVRAVLATHDAALCWADRAERLLTPAWRTTGWAFIRFHGGLAQPHPCYKPSTLLTRARLISEEPDQDTYVFFNNDTQGCAPHDAWRFAEACRELGLQVTRVPSTQPATT